MQVHWIKHGCLLFAGMTPLLAASVTGHIHIVEYLIKLPDLVSRTERVDALELLGATFVDKRRDMIGALELWKRAMDDRQDYFFVYTGETFLVFS
jgi:hypothetical protein